MFLAVFPSINTIVCSDRHQTYGSSSPVEEWGLEEIPHDQLVEAEERIKKRLLNRRNLEKKLVSFGPLLYEGREVPNSNILIDWIETIKNTKPENLLKIGSKNYSFMGVSVIYQNPRDELRLYLEKTPYVFISGTQTIRGLSTGLPIPEEIRLGDGQNYYTRGWEENDSFTRYVFASLQSFLEQEILRQGGAQKIIGQYYLDIINVRENTNFTFGHTEHEILEFLKSQEGMELINRALENKREDEVPKAITLHIISRYDMCGHCLNIAEDQLIKQFKEVVTEYIPINIVYYGTGPLNTTYISGPPFSSRGFEQQVARGIELERDLKVMHVELQR